MATTAQLMGLGVPGPLAYALGDSPGAPSTALLMSLGVAGTLADTLGDRAAANPPTALGLMSLGVAEGLAVVLASGSTVTPLGPTTASFTSGAASGSLVAALTGLQAGETTTSISPNDGRLAIAGGGTTLVVGLTASSVGIANYTVATSAGRTLALAVTTVAAAGQPLMNVATNGMIMNATATVSGAKTRQVGRTQKTIGSQPVTSLQVFFDNWYIQNATTAAAETDNASAITFQKVALVYNGVSAPITFSGARAATMSAGAVKFATDELTTQALFGLAQIPARSAIDIRWMVDVPAAGTFACTQNREVSPAEQAYLYDPSVTYTDNVDGTGALSVPSGATVAGISSGAVNAAGYVKPTMLGGRAVGAFVSEFVLGDSLTDGVGDSGGDGTMLATTTTGFGGGAYRRGAQVAGHAFMVCALSGRSLAHYVANRAKTIQYMPFHTHGVQALATNDVAGGVAAATANRRTAYADMKSAGFRKVVQSLIGAYTTSTNQWTDVAGQTATNGYAIGGNRDLINSAIIADVGSSGLDGYIDVRVAQDDATTNNAFKARGFSTTLSTALTGTAVATLSMAAAPIIGELLALDPTGVQSAAYVIGPVKSVTGSGPYTVGVWSGYVTTTKSAGTTISAMATKDGLHSAPLIAAAIANDNSANGMATVLGAFA